MANRTPDMPAHQSDQQRQQIAYPHTQTIIGEAPNTSGTKQLRTRSYRQHALKGYSVVKVDTGGFKKYSKKSGRKVVFGCQWGKYDAFKALKVNPEVHESKRRKGTSSSKCNCPFRIVAIEDPVTLKWKAFIKEEHHNHDPSSEPTSHPSHRRAGIANLSESSKQMVDILCLRNTPASQYGSSSTRGHGRCQGDFKGPMQHEAEGQKYSTWRLDCSAVVVR